MKTWTEKLPSFDHSKATIKVGELHTVAVGRLEVERRQFRSDTELFNFEDYVGGFFREDGWSNLANVERILARLNGCEVEVIIKILKFPEDVNNAKE